MGHAGRERLLEQSLEGEFEIQTETGTRRIALRGKADRIDLLRGRHVSHHRLQAEPRAGQEAGAATSDLHGLHRPAPAKDHGRGLGAGAGRLHRVRPGSAVRADAGARKRQGRDVRRRTGAPARRRRPNRARRVSADARRPIMCTRCAHAAVCRKDYVGDV